MQNNLDKPLDKKGIPFWGKNLYLFWRRKYTFFTIKLNH